MRAVYFDSGRIKNCACLRLYFIADAFLYQHFIAHMHTLGQRLRAADWTSAARAH